MQAGVALRSAVGSEMSREAQLSNFSYYAATGVKAQASVLFLFD